MSEFDTPPIPSSKVRDVFNEFSSHLEEIESIDHSEIGPLGSTRAILMKSSVAPDEAGDLDLIVLARDRADTILDIRGDLYEYFRDEDLPHKHFFKNIFSIAFENEVTAEPVQVDLIISERDPGKKMYRYSRDLKYHSFPAQTDNLNFEVKGLHRTELVRSFARVHGLSMATKGFAVYVWEPNHESYSGLMERLENKRERTRSEENLSMLEDLIEFLRDEFSNLEEIRNELFGTSPLVKYKYFINRAGVGPVVGKYASKTLENELANKRSLDHLDWEVVLEEFMTLNKMQILSFESACHNISSLLIEKRKVNHALLDYKDKLSGDGYWNDSLEKFIESVFKIDL